MSATVIADNPPSDGRQWDCQCARCGSSVEFERCDSCGGSGHTEPGELYELDPLWYGEDEIAECSSCGGEGSWPRCMSSREWCEANPLNGRADVPRGKVEWFAFDPKPEQQHA